MSHFVLLLYLLALGVGIACSVSLIPKKNNHKGLSEALTVNWLIALFTAWGAGVLYVAVNVASAVLFKVYADVFIVGALVILSALVAALPRQTNAVLSLGNKHLRLFYVLALLAVTGSLTVSLVFSEWRIVGVFIPLIVLLVAIARDHCLIHHYRKSTSLKPGSYHKCSFFVPLICLTLGLGEGLLFEGHVFERGVTVSLPIIYLITCFALWFFADQHFPYSGKALLPERLYRPKELTNKEFEVASAVHQGLSNKEIAYQLGVADSTVKNHLYSIFKKLDVRNRVALIQLLNQSARSLN